MSSDKSALKDLITSRSSIKGQITKFKNYLSAICRKSELSNLELAELSLKLTRFEGLSVKFDNLQNNIEILNSEEIDDEIDERESIENDIIINIAKAKTLIEEYNKLENQQRRDSVAADGHAQCLLDHQEIGFKLPQIQISKFDGSYFRWLEFRDTFESLIHNNSRIKSIHKFHYLISYLEGDAARIISNLEVSSANYAEAWRLLGERYDNKRLLINHHLSSLFNIQPLARETERSLRFLVDHVTKNLRALSSLGQPTDKWDILIIFMLSSKLDTSTLIKWEEYRNSLDDIPTLEQFHKFLIDRADVIEALTRSRHDGAQTKFAPSVSFQNNRGNYNTNNKPQQANNNKPFKGAFTKSFASMNQPRQSNYVCVICNENHKIYDCQTFKSKTMQDKLADVAKYKLCANCLRQGHPMSECRMGPCRECKKSHNSLLHPEPSEKVNVVSTNAASVVNFSERNGQVLLSTAIVEVTNPTTNETIRVRSVLDCGSQSTFITDSLKERLSLNSNQIDSLKVIGIGNNCTNNVVETCNVQMNSLNSTFSVRLSCLVLKELTGVLPKSPININKLNIPNNIILADPNFYQPAPIDMLIGADIFWDILGNEQMSLGPECPKLRSSKLGWLVSGPTNTDLPHNTIQCNHVSITKKSEDSIDDLLTKFWNLEELPENKSEHKSLSIKEQSCEKHFIANVCRLPTGRYMVKLPLTGSPNSLGDSYNLARRRFLSLEKKFKRNPALKNEYSKFIQEYADLGHLSESPIAKPNPSYFLCHHAVFKDNSESTALRVVFDGSASSSSGLSLNDILSVGPNVQDSLFSILVRARNYKYLLTGDIEKMYRQVLVHEDDRNLQLILWREDESQPIRTLQLDTLTYGTASASYLSTRCLQQVGEEQDDELIKTIIKHDFYVDDLITGSNDEEELRQIQISVSEALKSGCFNLRKFKTNSSKLFQNSGLNTKENLTISESTSTLGLGWDPTEDCFHFPIKNVMQQNNKITKRHIMSNSFKTFDPLGLVSPVVIQTKMMLQKLWQQKIDWDEPVPLDIEKEWVRYCENLPYISKIHIDRNVLCDNPITIELHSFSDASERALGACIYMRSIDVNGAVTVRLLCSKSKVAPIKSKTIPRMELCAALLAARLCKAVVESLRFKPDRLVHWCDSSVVLAWITNDLLRLKTFVANRISEIRETTQSTSWRYVPTSDNSADLISRGVDAAQLLSLNLWWTGPEFLAKNESEWPVSKVNIGIDNNLPEIKSNLANTCENEHVINFESYSKFTKLQRCYAYVKRFIFNVKNPKDKRSGSLTTDELRESFHDLCVLAQGQSFPVEYELFIKNNPLSPRSSILSLSPFMDTQKVIRVGGRIEASNYTFEKKHPILLHSSHRLTKLYFEYEHLRSLHAGPQLLLAAVRETVWPIKGRHLARRTVNNCVRCRRLRAKTLCPKMGSLPAQRITPDFPFLSVGLDFAGPFQILNRKGRGGTLIKCYLCLFICFRYKCIHLEIVSDLSKDAFVMTLRRFIARRGKPAEIFCDNGRNFVAAAKEVGKFIKDVKDPLCDTMNQEGIKFTFTPTYAPHFGGIWESGVKSAKYHLKRVMGNSNLTFEEITTLFSQVEAILNSRPLYPLSSCPDDLLSLSPGHFLIGRPLTALPSPALENCNESSLRRYARIERLHQHFWRRWQKEYIAELQQRTKWRVNNAKLNVGDLVLLHEDNAPPLCWRLGRVTRLFPGPDGVSRVADVTTTRGCVRRPLTRLCPLPSDEELLG